MSSAGSGLVRDAGRIIRERKRTLAFCLALLGEVWVAVELSGNVCLFGSSGVFLSGVCCWCVPKLVRVLQGDGSVLHPFLAHQRFESDWDAWAVVCARLLR